jgi:hypothetical protein
MYEKNEMVISLALLAVFLVALIAAGVTVARFSLSRINQAFDGLDPQTSIVLGVSATVALLCSALIGRAIHSAKQREIDSRVHSDRVAQYQALMESLGVLVSEESTSGRNGTVDLFALEKALFLRGSVAVNNEYRALLRLMSDRERTRRTSGAKSQDSSSRCVETAASLPMGWKARIGLI